MINTRSAPQIRQSVRPGRARGSPLPQHEEAIKASTGTLGDEIPVSDSFDVGA
ncbi:hypothetical protein [Lentzea sp. HUAS12]|uniref:hypothetical protein n=1 Tax=Lentzea sp. HUAS12 TaxID=2951806 RepID=UPI00209D93B3|nr:hypothetical protein [Lentzea sp. HUAS12]USX53551.1 hypothetical protein ND450_05450 [Lentzea sp. HUAS12]